MNNSLKENVKRIAKERVIPLSQIEKDLGFSEKYISKWDKNNPSINNVVAVAEYLGVTVDALVGYEGDPESDLKKLTELASWLTDEELAALLAIAEQLKKGKA